MFTSLAGDADYIWLAARTDPEAKKHKGISMFARPDGHARDQRRRRCTCSASTTSTTPSSTTCASRPTTWSASENKGWTLITNQLNHERVTLCSSGIIERGLDEVRHWAQETKLADGRRVIDQEWVQVNLARVRAKLEFLRLINWKVAWTRDQGHLDVADASSIKVFGTEFYLEAFRLLMEIIGERATCRRARPTPSCGAGWSELSQPADPDLRRRHQRDPAGPDRHVRPGLPRRSPLEGGRTGPWISP